MSWLHLFTPDQNTSLYRNHDVIDVILAVIDFNYSSFAACFSISTSIPITEQILNMKTTINKSVIAIDKFIF